MLICHSLRGSVDWNPEYDIAFSCRSGHSLRGSVDWNLTSPMPFIIVSVSLPSWECGLKFQWSYIWSGLRNVTPFVGVWIEIVIYLYVALVLDGHSLRGSVDWNRCPEKACWKRRCHSLRGSVDWNFYFINRFFLRHRHSLRGSVDWNSTLVYPISFKEGHSLRGSVDWNYTILKS